MELYRALLLRNSRPEHVRASKTPAAFKSNFLARISQVWSQCTEKLWHWPSAILCVRWYSAVFRSLYFKFPILEWIFAIFLFYLLVYFTVIKYCFLFFFLCRPSWIDDLQRDLSCTCITFSSTTATARYYQLIGPGAHTRDSNLRFMSNKGVTQGSVLGPLLFNVYVSSLHDAARAKNVSLPSFADDFTLYSIRPTMTEAADAATSALQDISILLEEKGLTISEEKTASMMIASSFSTNNPKPLMYLNNSPIKMVSQAVLLGVTVDENLTWSAHIDALHRRICRKIGVLRRTMRHLTSASRRQFLISVIQPDFEYTAVAFVPSMSMSGKQRLLALWRKAVRCAAMAD